MQGKFYSEGGKNRIWSINISGWSSRLIWSSASLNHGFNAWLSVFFHLMLFYPRLLMHSRAPQSSKKIRNLWINKTWCWIPPLCSGLVLVPLHLNFVPRCIFHILIPSTCFRSLYLLLLLLLHIHPSIPSLLTQLQSLPLPCHLTTPPPPPLHHPPSTFLNLPICPLQLPEHLFTIRITFSSSLHLCSALSQSFSGVLRWPHPGQQGPKRTWLIYFLFYLVGESL